jgi:hypothetical protein
MKKTIQIMLEDSRSGNRRAVHSWNGEIFRRFSFGMYHEKARMVSHRLLCPAREAVQENSSRRNEQGIGQKGTPGGQNEDRAPDLHARKKAPVFSDVKKQGLEYNQTRCRETTWEMYAEHCVVDTNK